MKSFIIIKRVGPKKDPFWSHILQLRDQILWNFSRIQRNQTNRKVKKKSKALLNQSVFSLVLAAEIANTNSLINNKEEKGQNAESSFCAPMLIWDFSGLTFSSLSGNCLLAVLSQSDASLEEADLNPLETQVSGLVLSSLVQLGAMKTRLQQPPPLPPPPQGLEVWVLTVFTVMYFH